jgi:hypothetical protein
LKLTIAPPRPSWIDAGVSPMIAPITLAVAEIFRAEKRNGSEEGNRSFQSTERRSAA